MTGGRVVESPGSPRAQEACRPAWFQGRVRTALAMLPASLPVLLQIIVEEKKAATDELIVSIGREKAVVDEAVEAGRGDEEAAAALQVRAPGMRWAPC